MPGIRKQKQEDKAPEDAEERALATKLYTIWQGYTDATFKYRRQWYLNDNFYDGKHFVWWRKSTGTIDRVQPPKGMSLRSIPIASKQLDATANMILANDPRWVVYPEKDMEGNIGQDQEDIAKRSGQWLEFQWDRLNMREQINDLVHFALKLPFAFFEVGFDNDIWVAIDDAFSILFSPEVKSIYDSPVLIKAITKPIDEVQNNPHYNDNKFKVTPITKYSPDDMKDLRMVEQFGYHRSKADNSCDLKEFYIKEYVQTPDKEHPVTRIRIVTLANDSLVLRDDLTDLEEYPFVLFAPQAGALFKPSWLERMMPQNKSLDLVVSNIETFFHMMNRGYWIKHKNANVSRVVNETGSFIEWDVVKPEQANLAQIPNYVFAHMQNLERWISQQGVQSGVTSALPKGVKAYKAIESLKQNDFASMGTAIVRLETAIEKVAEIMLDFAERYYTEPRNVYRLNEEKPDYFSVVSSQFAQPGGNATPLKADYKVDVQIESGLAYTEEGKRQTMMELYSLGLMPAEKVLETFRFSNVGEIIREAQAEKQISMIDTQDFQALDDSTKKLVLQELMQKNVNLPQSPQPDATQFRRRGLKGGKK